MERSVTVLFADLAGFTALTEAHGDADAADIADRFYAMARASLCGDAHLVKTIGDAVMVVAFAVSDAVSTALALAVEVDAVPSFPALRAGLHAGQAVERNGDYFGAAVNLAARVGAHARSGQILCTGPVASAVTQHALACVASIGPCRFKNVQDEVELYELGALRPRGAQIDPVCRMAVALDAAALQIEHRGRTFYFCSPACAERFAASPDQFARG